MHIHFDGFPHVMVSQQFSRQWIEESFLPLTDEMENIFKQGGCDLLRGKRMVSLFYQASTRTKMSFEMAHDYLGGRVVFSTENAREFSSAVKGEKTQDAMLVVDRYRPDVIVLRYDRDISSDLAVKLSKAAILNAGDREPGQHPTQGLLDIRTIFKRLGKIDGICVAMVGDLVNGRTVRSLAYLLGKFRGVKIHFISPANTKMKDDVKHYLDKHGVDFYESTDLRKIAPQVDVIYQTRTQEECGAKIDRNNHDLGYFMVNKEICDLMKPDAVIMHPLPRVDEITEEVDSDPRAAYLTDQIDSGLLTRMALLKMILTPNL